MQDKLSNLVNDKIKSTTDTLSLLKVITTDY